MNSQNSAKRSFFNLFSKNKVFKLALFTFAVLGGFFIFSFSASAATYVSGTILTDTTWTAANSPYVVSSVTVNSGVILTIDPGVIVKFPVSSYYLGVAGVLQVNGTATDKVYFTSIKDDTVGGDTNGDGSATTPAAGNWGYIQFTSSSQGNISNAVLRYGGGSSWDANCSSRGVICNTGGSITITSSEISNQPYGVWLAGGTTTISQSSIHDNSQYGVYIASSSVTLTLTNNTFTNNSNLAYIDGANFIHSGNTASGTGIKGFIINGSIATNRTWNPDLPYIVQNLTINSGATLTLNPGAIVKFKSNAYLIVSGTLNASGTSTDKIYFTSIKDDTVGGDTNGDGSATTPAGRDWGWLYFDPASQGNISNSVIRYGGLSTGNNQCISIICNGGGTLNIQNSQIGYNLNHGIHQASGSLTLTSSEINNNYIGVYITGGNATITGSSIHDNSYYGVYNSSANIINAENNWWGNASGPYHATLNPTGTGNKASNNVDFTPWLTSDPLTVNNSPIISNLNQFKSDSITQILENGITQESTVVFKAALQDQDNDQVKLQVELKEKDQSFDGANLIESDFVSSGSTAAITRYGLVPQSYHWRGRVADSRGGVSEWQEFGTVGNIDFTVSRTIKIAVILAEPSDKSFDPAHGKNYFETQIIPDVEDYYCEVSFGTRGQDGICRDGLVNLEFEVFDDGGMPYKLSQTQQYYGENYSPKLEIDINGDGVIDLEDDDKTEVFAWDAINLADVEVNYINYESVIIIHSEHSELSAKIAGISCLDCIKTQHWGVSFALTNNSTESAKRWIVLSENEGIGYWAHEFGHALGSILVGKPLCDLYKGANCGDIKEWDVMGNDWLITNTSTPPQFSSFSKEQLKWMKEQFIDYGNYDVESLETMKFNADSADIKKFSISSNSYYLFETRTDKSNYSYWDRTLSGDSLVVYKVKKYPQYDVINVAAVLNQINNIGYDIFKNLRISLNNFSADTMTFKANINLQSTDNANSTGLVLSPQILLLNFLFNPDKPQQIDISTKNDGSPSALIAPLRGFRHQFLSFQYEILNPVIYFLISPLLGILIMHRIIWFYWLKKVGKFASFKEFSGAALTVGVFAIISLLVAARINEFLYYGNSISVGTAFRNLTFVLLAVFGVFILFSSFIRWFVKNYFSKEIINTTDDLKFKTIVKKIIFINIMTIVLLLMLLIWIFIYFYTEPSYRSFDPTRPQLLISTSQGSLDLDLHAITPDGKHTGMNYETEEYENQIPNAIASGDLVYDDEWIFVPEGTQVKYYTSSYDIQQFLEQNPDIAQQLPTTDETYTLSAIYYDGQSQKYESAPLANQSISPAQNIIYETTGTTDISITPGVVDSQPPATSIFLSGTAGNNNWYISDVQVVLSAQDNDGGAGLLKTEYSLDNGQTWTTYSVPFIYDIEGQNTLFYRSQDLVGNLEQTKSQEIKLDKTAPTIFASDLSAEQTTEQGTYLEIQAFAQDNIDQNPTLASDKPLSQTFPSGTTDILLTSADQVGNTAEKTITVTVFSTPTIDPDGDCVLNQDDVKPFDGSVFANFTLPQEYSFFEKEIFTFPFSAAGVGIVQISYSDIYYETQEYPIKDSQGNIIPTTVTSQDGTTFISFSQSTKQNINYKLTLKTKKGNKQEKQRIAKKKDEETNQEKKQELEKELKFVSAPITFTFKSQICPNTLIQSSNINIYDKEKNVSVHYKYKDNQEPQLILKTDETIQLTKGQPFVFVVKVTNLPKETPFFASLSGNLTLLETFDEEEHNEKEHRKEKKFYLFYPSAYQGVSDIVTLNLTVGNVSVSNTLNVEFGD